MSVSFFPHPPPYVRSACMAVTRSPWIHLHIHLHIIPVCPLVYTITKAQFPPQSRCRPHALSSLGPFQQTAVSQSVSVNIFIWFVLINECIFLLFRQLLPTYPQICKLYENFLSQSQNNYVPRSLWKQTCHLEIKFVCK